MTCLRRFHIISRHNSPYATFLAKLDTPLMIKEVLMEKFSIQEAYQPHPPLTYLFVRQPGFK